MIRDRIKELRRVPAKALIPNNKNWRRHPKRQQEAIRAALDEIGYADALIAREDENGRLVLIDGHLRAGTTPEETVPVLVLDVDEKEADKLLATLDPLAGMAEADEAMWAGLIGGIESENESFRDLLADLHPQSSLAREGEDDVPDSGVVVSITQTGDVWQLGKHRLMCGDATKAADVEKVLAGARPNLMVTDPPYGVGYDPGWRNAAADAGFIDYAARRVGEVDNDDRIDWSDAWHLFFGNIVYCWHAGRHASNVQDSLVGAGFDIRSQIIWAKQRFAISRGDYHWQHEPCWYAVRKHSAGAWKGDRSQTTLWHVESVIGDEAKNNHSTQKPVECMRRPMVNHTERGDGVYDPFVGSGTTIIAAETLDRVCYAMEINPLYVDIAVNRWEKFTGKKAELLKQEPVLK